MGEEGPGLIGKVVMICRSRDDDGRTLLVMGLQKLPLLRVILQQAAIDSIRG